MIAMVLRIDVSTLVGLAVFAGCVFAAGWFLRREHEIWLRTPAGKRRQWAKSDRDRGGFIGRSPW